MGYRSGLLVGKSLNLKGRFCGAVVASAIGLEGNLRSAGFGQVTT